MGSNNKDGTLIVGPFLRFAGRDTMRVIWETGEDVLGEVAYGPPGSRRDRVADPHPVSLHRATLTGLTPGGVYDYTVAATGKTLFRGTFRMPPDRDTYRVVIFGDPHSPAGGFRSLAQRIARENPDFIVCLGDIVASPRHSERWPSFFEMSGGLFARIPFTAAVGNHDVDGGSSPYDRYIGKPVGTPTGYYYDAFDVGPDRFIILDSRNDQLFFHHGFWLIGRLRELARRTDVRHIFVFSHIGPVSYKALRRGFIGLKPLLPLMIRAGVSAIFSGHDHHYVRGTIHRGFPFFVSGGGGGKLQPVNRHSPYGWFAGKKQAEAVTHHFLVLDVAEGRCTVRAIDDRGTVIDEVELLQKAGRAATEE
jgi:hypothetical protein